MNFCSILLILSAGSNGRLKSVFKMHYFIVLLIKFVLQHLGINVQESSNFESRHLPEKFVELLLHAHCTAMIAEIESSWLQAKKIVQLVFLPKNSLSRSLQIVYSINRNTVMNVCSFLLIWRERCPKSILVTTRETKLGLVNGHLRCHKDVHFKKKLTWF